MATEDRITMIYRVTTTVEKLDDGRPLTTETDTTDR